MNQNLKNDSTMYYVVHPLDDLPEEKRRVDELKPTEMTRGVRMTLTGIQGYLVIMLLLVAYHVLMLAGALH